MNKLALTEDQKNQMEYSLSDMSDRVHALIDDGDFFYQIEEIFESRFEEMSEDQIDAVFEYLNEIEGDVVTQMLIDSLQNKIALRMEDTNYDI
jgi:hypothetical protein